MRVGIPRLIRHDPYVSDRIGVPGRCRTRMTRKNGRTRSLCFGPACHDADGKAEDDRRFLEALHFFIVENVRWRALPERFGP